MRRAAALVLALACGAALAQEAKREEKPAGKAAPPQRPLNLKLDQPARLFVQEAPAEKDADRLPELGGGSTSFERRPEQARVERGSPFPKDSENQNR